MGRAFESHRGHIKYLAMVVLIETELGELANDVSVAAWMGVRSLNAQNPDQYIVKKVSEGSLSIVINNCRQEHGDRLIMPVGYMPFMRRASELLGVELPKPLNIPDSLKPYIGRRVWESGVKDVRLPCFVKPLEQAKLFTGFVATKEPLFELYPELQGWEGKLFCSEDIGEILSEWRCYVAKGKVYSCASYNSETPTAFPDQREILRLISLYEDAPAGYSLDVAVTPMGTKLIECNDAWSLGYYGGEFTEYFRMLRLRWVEIVNAQKV